jgi:hypothetical protein
MDGQHSRQRIKISGQEVERTGNDPTHHASKVMTLVMATVLIRSTGNRAMATLAYLGHSLMLVGLGLAHHERAQHQVHHNERNQDRQAQYATQHPPVIAGRHLALHRTEL